VFGADVKSGALPQYSFIEPRFTHFLGAPSDNHPPHDDTYGEILLADVYNTLIGNPQVWQQTLLIVTYDEHGGCFDHQPPPYNATPPDANTASFDFKSIGPRVPALLISPYIPAGTIFRGAEGTIDHTSVIKTVRNRFCPGAASITARDAAASSLEGVLQLPNPVNNPPAVAPPAPTSQATLEHLTQLRAAPPTQLAQDLLHLRDVLLSQK